MANRRPGLDEQPLRLEGLEVDLAAERPSGSTHDFGGGSGRTMLWLGAGVAGLVGIVLGTSLLIGDEPTPSPARPLLASGLVDEVAEGLGHFTAQRLNARLEAMPKAPMMVARRATAPTAAPTTPAIVAVPAPTVPVEPSITTAAPAPSADAEAPASAPVAAPPANEEKPFSRLPTIAPAQDDPEQDEVDADANDVEPRGQAERSDEAPNADADADPPAADAPVEEHTDADVAADEAHPV